MDIPKKYRNRVRVCIDTCHLFAAGQDADTQEFRANQLPFPQWNGFENT